MKRRTKRKMKKFFVKHELMLFVMLIMCALFSVGGAYSILSKQVDVTGTGTIVDNQFATSGGTCPFELSFEQTNSWGEYSIIMMTVKNISEWQWKSYVFTLSNMSTMKSFIGPFRSQTITDDGDTYLLFPDSYLLPLNPGESKTYQLQIETSTPYEEIISTLDVPNCGRDNPYGELIMSGGASLRLNKYERQLDTSIELYMQDQWDGQHYKITITNNTDYDIYDWRLVVYFNGETYVATYGHTGIELLIEQSRMIGNGTYTVPANGSIEFFLVLDTDPSYLPDIIGAGSQPN